MIGKLRNYVVIIVETTFTYVVTRKIAIYLCEANGTKRKYTILVAIIITIIIVQLSNFLVLPIWF